MTFTHKTFALFILIGIVSCSSDSEYIELIDDVSIDENTSSDLEILARTLNLPANSFNYENVVLPDYFLNNGTAQEDNTPNNNPITDEGATLGRVLFYDNQLSVNNAVSCSSCHDQSKGFTDVNTLSVGFNGELTARNSMGLANA